MPYALYANGKVVGFAQVAPPSAEIGWVEVAEEDPLLQAFLNPIPEAQPDWDQFRSQVGIHGAYLRVASANGITAFLNTQLVAALWQVGNSPQILGDVMNLWNAMVYAVPLTLVEAGQLRAIALSCNMKFTLDDQGMMVGI